MQFLIILLVAAAVFGICRLVDKAFSKHFGNLRLSGCSWLTTGMDGHMTASEWNDLMRWTAYAMDARSKQLLMEKIWNLIGSFRK